MRRVTGGADESTVRRSFGYRTPMLGWFAPLAFVAFTFGLLAVFALTAMGEGPPLWFGVVWVAATIWALYWLCWRIGLAVEVEGTRVTWRALLRRRRLDVAVLTGNDMFVGLVDELIVRGEEPLMVLALDDSWTHFIHSLNKVHAQHPFVTWPEHQTGSRRFMTLFLTGYFERWE